LKIKINRNELINALTTVSDVVSENKIRPVISGVKIETLGKNVMFTGTNLEQTIVIEKECEIEESGKVVFQTTQVIEYLKQCENKDIEITSTESYLNIDNDADFVVYDASEYPVLKLFNTDEKKSIIDVSVFIDALERVKFSSVMSDNLSLECVRLEIEKERMLTCATDTFRMIYLETELKSDIELKVSLPLQTVNTLIKSLKGKSGNIEICLTGNNIKFTFEKMIMTSRLIELEFPNFKEIIKGINSSKDYFVNVADLNKSLKKVNIFARDNISAKNAGNFKFEKKLVISSKNDKSKGKDSLEYMSETKEAFSINLNIKFILDFLAVFNKSTLMMRMNTENSAVVFQAENDNKFIYLTMPISLKED